MDEGILRLGALMTCEEMREKCRKSPVGIYHHLVSWCRQIMGAVPATGPGARQGLYELPNTTPRQDGGRQRAAIRIIGARGIQFQRSKRRGVHREELSILEQMMEDIAEVDFYICIDCRNYPEVHVYKLKSDRLLNYVYRRRMGLNGLSRSNFDKFIRENFETRWRDISFARLMRETLEREANAAPAREIASPRDEDHEHASA